MKLAILHYHLNRGGVTQVIVNHLRSLVSRAAGERPIEEVVILYGGRRQGWPDAIQDELAGLPLSLVAVPSLDYDSGKANPALSDDLLKLLGQHAMLPGNSLLHVHNHALGKNAALPGTLTRLAEIGYRQLLQIHDFAEDSRPANYRHLIDALDPPSSDDLAGRLYPQASHIHYATLNGRDHALLAEAGIHDDRLHYLPNPVTPLGSLVDRSSAREKLRRLFGVDSRQRFVLYPVRPIRRKNLGEMLLWATVSDATSYGVTLIPINERERQQYRVWCDLVNELQLPVLWGLGEKGGLQFGENLAAADAVISTSVAEGFGMVFLESWLAGCPLIGRDLPEITADFRRTGLRFPAMAPELSIPRGWLEDLTGLRALFTSELNRLLQSYGRPTLNAAAGEQAFDEWFHGDTIDFARLDVDNQARIIRHLRTDPGKRDELFELNPNLAAGQQADRESCEQLTQENAACVEKSHSLAVSGRRLLTLYNHLANCSVGEVTPLSGGSSILRALLHPTRLHLIRLTV